MWAFSSYDAKAELYKINIRSRGIVINEIAEKFNGGGHKFASGVKLKSFDDAMKLMNDLDKELLKYKEKLELEV